MMTVGICALRLPSHGQCRRSCLALLAAFAACWAAFPAPSVAGPTILYSFSAPAYPVSLVTNSDGSVLGSTNFSIITNSDGVVPSSKLVLANGYLYGTSRHGGTNGAGSSFPSPPMGISPTSILSKLLSRQSKPITRPITIWSQVIWCRDLTQISTALPGAAAPISPGRFL